MVKKLHLAVVHSYKEILRWEKMLYDRFFKGWFFFAFLAGIVLTLLFLYTSHNFIFSHPNFIILVLIPPVITWHKWSSLTQFVLVQANPSSPRYADRVYARLAILSFTIKLYGILFLIFKIMPTVFIAPYEFVAATFWAHAFFIFLLHGVMFGVMSLLTALHTRPYLFFIFAYYPLAAFYYEMENSLSHLIGWCNVVLLIVAVGCQCYSLRRRAGQ